MSVLTFKALYATIYVTSRRGCQRPLFVVGNLKIRLCLLYIACECGTLRVIFRLQRAAFAASPFMGANAKYKATSLFMRFIRKQPARPSTKVTGQAASFHGVCSYAVDVNLVLASASPMLSERRRTWVSKTCESVCPWQSEASLS
jgi:hypothetical protein